MKGLLIKLTIAILATIGLGLNIVIVRMKRPPDWLIGLTGLVMFIIIVLLNHWWDYLIE